MDDKKTRVKILVACHKADPNIIKNDIYFPIQVGKSLNSELDLGFQCDDTGDNISDKNGSYCELTALYWAWKNIKNVDYIGLCHYRRYFGKKKPLVSIIKTSGNIFLRNLIDINEINNLKSNQVILPTFWTMPMPNYLSLIHI